MLNCWRKFPRTQLHKMAETCSSSPRLFEAAALLSMAGNVRELENVIERAVIIAPWPLSLRDVLPLHNFQPVLERKSSDAVPLSARKASYA